MSSSEQTQGAGFAARTATRPPSERGAAAGPGDTKPDTGSGSTPGSTSGARSGAKTEARSGRSAERPSRPSSSAPRPGAPRRVRLTVARLDPWSVMKLSFLLSVALGIALVVSAGVLWTILDGMGVFADINRVTSEVLAQPFDVLEFVGFAKVLSLATVIAVVDVVLITALATLGAFLYNVASSLVGGLHVTLSDD